MVYSTIYGQINLLKQPLVCVVELNPDKTGSFYHYPVVDTTCVSITNQHKRCFYHVFGLSELQVK